MPPFGAVVTLTVISRAFAGQAQVSNTQPRRDAQTGTIMDIHVSSPSFALASPGDSGALHNVARVACPQRPAR